MIRLLSGILFALGASLLGLAAKRHYKNRHDVYCELCAFCNFLKNEISFLKTPITEAIKEFTNGKKSQFCQILKNYAECVGQKKESKDLGVDIASLNEKEKIELKKFFNSLGRLPQKEQLCELENYLQRFNEMEKRTAEESKRLGGMYFKLCILLGVALLIIII